MHIIIIIIIYFNISYKNYIYKNIIIYTIYNILLHIYTNIY